MEKEILIGEVLMEEAVTNKRNKKKGAELIQTLVMIGLVLIVIGSIVFYFGQGKKVVNEANETSVGEKTVKEIVADPASAMKGE